MNRKKFILDISMILIYILLMNFNFTGALLHEILGLFIWSLYLLHLIFNKRWIISVTKNFTKIIIKAKTRFIYILDILLFFTMIILTVSGISISIELFPFLNNNIEFWKNIHTISSNVGILIMTLHIVTHFSFFERQIRNFIYKNQNSKDQKRKIASIIATVALLIITTYGFAFNSDLFKFKNNKTDNNNSTSIPQIKNKESQSTPSQNNPTYNSSSSSSSQDDKKYSSSSSQTQQDDDQPTLQEFLSRIICDGCPRRCLLSNPKCGIGKEKAKQETQNYYATYSSLSKN